MPIEFDCPHCTSAIRVGDSGAGKVGKCPRCKEKIRVPLPSPVGVQPKSTPPDFDSQALDQFAGSLERFDGFAGPVETPQYGLMPCPDCTRDISPRAHSCPHCGCPLVVQPQHPVAFTPSYGHAPSRGLAIVLAWFFGGLGIHRFYLGQPIVGLLYLLFCWTLIPSIVAFLEGLVWTFTSERSWQMQYGPAAVYGGAGRSRSSQRGVSWIRVFVLVVILAALGLLCLLLAGGRFRA